MFMHVCVYCASLFAPANAKHVRCADCRRRGINEKAAPCVDCGELRPRGRGSRPVDQVRCQACRRRAWGLRPDEKVGDHKVTGRKSVRPRYTQCRKCDSPIPDGRVAYCSPMCARKRARLPKASTSARGYGSRHQRLRAQLLPLAYGQDCHLCGSVMLPDQELHLDHTPDRTSYRGFAHAWCNSRDGLRRAQEAIRKKRLGEVA